MGQAGHQSGTNWIAGDTDNGNCFRRALRGTRDQGSRRDQNVQVESEQFSNKSGDTVSVTLGVAFFERQVASDNPSSVR
jgi:hypothetical protein